MKNVQVPTSDNYNDYLKSVLKDPEHAAAFITAILEEENPEPELLLKALLKVANALGEANLTPEELKEQQQKLKNIFCQQGNDFIYGLEDWLNALGLKLTVTVFKINSK